MPIIGFNFDKILCEKKDPIKGPVKVNSDISIKSIEKEKLNIGKSEEILKFKFEVKIIYEKIGSIEFKGNVLYLDEPKKMKEILTEWTKKKNLPQEIASQIINTILFKCNVKALALEQDINLPPHIRLPKLTPAKDPKEYIG